MVEKYLCSLKCLATCRQGMKLPGSHHWLLVLCLCWLPSGTGVFWCPLVYPCQFLSPVSFYLIITTHCAAFWVFCLHLEHDIFSSSTQYHFLLNSSLHLGLQLLNSWQQKHTMVCARQLLTGWAIKYSDICSFFVGSCQYHKYPKTYHVAFRHAGTVGSKTWKAVAICLSIWKCLFTVRALIEG